MYIDLMRKVGQRQVNDKDEKNLLNSCRPAYFIYEVSIFRLDTLSGIISGFYILYLKLVPPSTLWSIDLVIGIYIFLNLAFIIKLGLYLYIHGNFMSLIRLLYYVTDYVINYLIIRFGILNKYYK